MRTWTTRCSLAVLFGLATTAARADPLVILTTSVPPATARTTYVQTLQASGGTQPYVWSVSSGDLPLGIALVPCGDLAGSAGSDGDFSFTVRVSDASGQF